MLDLLNLYRYEGLEKYYFDLKKKAKTFLKEGDLSSYVDTLVKINDVRLQMVGTVREKDQQSK